MHAEQLRDALAPHVEAGDVPGVVVGVDRGGAVSLAAAGATAPRGPTPLAPDALVRASSNTKPITAALALHLVEQGTLGLDEPIERHVPELADRRVLVRVEDPVSDAATEPAERPITLGDLLTMRMGFGWVWDRDCPTLDAALDVGVGLGPPDPAGLPAPEAWLARFAPFPLLHHPGRAWRYDLSMLVLGVLIPRATGRALPELLAERVLGPLGMSDTGFVAPDLDRLVPAWRRDDGGALEAFDAGGADSAWARPPAFPDARGGLVSSATDLLRFARALLDGGAGVLAPASVAAMTADRLTPGQSSDPTAAPFLDGGGWGLGLGVHPATPVGPRYGWAGGLGTLWWSWPEHDTAAVMITQMTPPVGGVFETFRTATERALAAG